MRRCRTEHWRERGLLNWRQGVIALDFAAASRAAEQKELKVELNIAAVHIEARTAAHAEANVEQADRRHEVR
jgi:hypothetical protein